MNKIYITFISLTLTSCLQGSNVDQIDLKQFEQEQVINSGIGTRIDEGRSGIKCTPSYYAQGLC